MKKVLLYTILCISLVAMLSACSSLGGSQTTAPTMDVSVIRTEVVAAMQAAFTQEALSKPSEEPTMAVTQTPYVITATFEPTSATPQLVASLTPAKAIVIATKAAPTKIPGPARLISQSPYDNTKFSPGESFDAVFTIQNNSTRNWNKSYYIRTVGGGDLVPNQTQVMISDNVDIGKSTTFSVDYVAPGIGGKHTSYWELVDDNGAAILAFYLIINVE